MPCCGFESVPIDLAVYRAITRLGTSHARVRAWVAASLTPSTGSIASVAGALRRPGDTLRAVRGLPDGHPGAVGIAIPCRTPDGRLALPLPTLDGAIVGRTAAHLGWNTGFTFEERAIVAGILPFIRTLLRGGLKLVATKLGTVRPVSDPDEATRARHRVHLDVVAIAAAGSKTRIQIHGGDPGYDETASIAAEAVLTLLERQGPGGVLTPAVALGDPLWQRLGNVLAISEEGP